MPSWVACRIAARGVFGANGPQELTVASALLAEIGEKHDGPALGLRRVHQLAEGGEDDRDGTVMVLALAEGLSGHAGGELRQDLAHRIGRSDLIEPGGEVFEERLAVVLDRLRPEPFVLREQLREVALRERSGG